MLGRRSVKPWQEPTLRPAVESLFSLIEDSSIESPPIGIGWSLGAITLMEMELERPGTFRGLILIGATPSFVSTDEFPWGQKRALVRRMRADLKSDPIETLNRFYRLNFTGNELQGEEAVGFTKRYAAINDIDINSLANGLETLYKTDISLKIRSLRLPVLIIHGSLDSVTPIGAANYLADNIKDSRLFTIEGAGARSFLDRAEVI